MVHVDGDRPPFADTPDEIAVSARPRPSIIRTRFNRYTTNTLSAHYRFPRARPSVRPFCRVNLPRIYTPSSLFISTYKTTFTPRRFLSLNLDKLEPIDLNMEIRWALKSRAADSDRKLLIAV